MIGDGSKDLDQCKMSFTIYSNPKASDIIGEPHNCILDMNLPIECMNNTIDNESTYGISEKIIQLKQPSFHNSVTS